MKIYNVGFINNAGKKDETQLDVEERSFPMDEFVELFNLILTLKDELEMRTITYIELAGNGEEADEAHRYYICALSYDKDGSILDYEKEFGDFDDLSTARSVYAEIVKTYHQNPAKLFEKSAPEIAVWHIQLEDCFEEDALTTCEDVIAEEDFYRPVFTDFCGDMEKMEDFNSLTKEEFLRSYSYLTEEEYELTEEKIKKGGV